MLFALVYAVLVGRRLRGFQWVSVNGVELDDRCQIQEDQRVVWWQLIAKMRGNGVRWVEVASSTYPIEGIVLLPAVVIAFLALDSQMISRYQEEEKGWEGDITHNLLEVLAKDGICDFDGGHGYTIKEEGVLE